jgi:hypothetical protein
MFILILIPLGTKPSLIPKCVLKLCLSCSKPAGSGYRKIVSFGTELLNSGCTRDLSDLICLKLRIL